MWNVKGKTVEGKDVEYKVPAGKDTDKAFVMALAFQEHGKVSPDDALTSETTVTWTSDNVFDLPTPITIVNRSNYAVDRRIGKGVWERHSQRAFRSPEAAAEALESAASENPNDVFRVVKTLALSEVISVSKNGMTQVGEKPDPKPEEKKEGKEQPTLDEAKEQAKEAPAKPDPKARTPKAA